MPVNRICSFVLAGLVGVLSTSTWALDLTTPESLIKEYEQLMVQHQIDQAERLVFIFANTTQGAKQPLADWLSEELRVESERNQGIKQILVQEVHYYNEGKTARVYVKNVYNDGLELFESIRVIATDKGWKISL